MSNKKFDTWDVKFFTLVSFTNDREQVNLDVFLASTRCKTLFATLLVNGRIHYNPVGFPSPTKSLQVFL